MRFPIDVIFVARDGRVLKIRHQKWARIIRATIAARAFAAIEMAAGEARRHRPISHSRGQPRQFFFFFFKK